uniref:Putative secreted protein n=1 Tax=Anopheles darlingi TaxID=43151 RepID=A0A2M4DLY0_ANODA
MTFVAWWQPLVFFFCFSFSPGVVLSCLLSRSGLVTVVRTPNQIDCAVDRFIVRFTKKTRTRVAFLVQQQRDEQVRRALHINTTHHSLPLF